MLRIVSVGRPRLPPVTGTPIEKTDAHTRTVFGDYISIYDIQRAVADEATKPIYYESRIAKLVLNAAELPKLDAEFESITESEELMKKEKLKTKWAALIRFSGSSRALNRSQCHPIGWGTNGLQTHLV